MIMHKRTASLHYTVIENRQTVFLGNIEIFPKVVYWYESIIFFFLAWMIELVYISLF